MTDAQIAQLASLLQRLEAVVVKLEGGKGQSGEKAASGSGKAPQVDAYTEYFNASVAPFLANSRDIGGDLNGLADLVEEGFKEVGKLVDVASQSKKPSDEEFGEMVGPIANVFSKITEYKDKRRGSDFYNHEFAVDEGIKCLAWVTIDKTPVAYTKEMVNAAQFYNNKVLVAYKNKDKRHVDFVEQEGAVRHF